MGEVVARRAVGEAAVAAVAGDLTAQGVDAVVNAANVHLRHGGGVAAAIVRAGGPIVQQESDRWVAENGPLEPGIAAVTTAGEMPAEVVVHVAGPVYDPSSDANEPLLRKAVAAALQAAAGAGARSVALPAISAGIYGYPLADAAATIADEVVRWLDAHRDALDEVRLVGFDRAAAEGFAGALTRATGT